MKVADGVSFQLVFSMDESVVLEQADAFFEGAHPDAMLMVFMHIIHLIAGQSVDVVVIVKIMPHLSSGGDAVKAIALCAYPQPVLGVFCQTVDVGGKTGWLFVQLAVLAQISYQFAFGSVCDYLSRQSAYP